MMQVEVSHRIEEVECVFTHTTIGAKHPHTCNRMVMHLDLDTKKKRVSGQDMCNAESAWCIHLPHFHECL